MTDSPPAAAAPVVPRPAATTLILRDGDAGLEVLMVRRSPTASFMPGAYVFPGGAVDADDGGPAALAGIDEDAQALERRIGAVTHVGPQAPAFAVAALRECFEECGLWLLPPGHAEPVQALLLSLRMLLHGGHHLAGLAAGCGLPLATSALQPWAHWCTPVGLPKRFDTLFFVVAAPPGQEPSVDAGETTTLAWVHPPAALDAHARGDFPMEFATVSTVRSLAPHAGGTVAALLAHAAALTDLPAIHPRLKRDAEGRIRGVLMPGDDGYDQAA
ncbi:MAG: NUDIX hydrolase [Aquabacterium sp.]